MPNYLLHLSYYFGNNTNCANLFTWVVQPNGIISFRQVDLINLPEQSLTKLVLKTRQESLGINGRSAMGVVDSNAIVRANLELEKLDLLQKSSLG